jgi:hypothetical protein
VIKLLAEGKSTKDVAALLQLSVKTAETHRSNIMSKLGLHSVSELVLYAVRNNIVQAVNSKSTGTDTHVSDTHVDGDNTSQTRPEGNTPH